MEAPLPEYVRRSRTLREQKSAYEVCVKWAYETYVKPGGTAG